MRTNYLAALLGLAVGSCALVAQASDGPVPVAATQGHSLKQIRAQDALKLKPLDMLALSNEDLADEANGMAPRYAMPVKSNIVPGRDGDWEPLGDGRVVWRYRISSGDAASLNFAFVPFQLPPSAALWVYSPTLSERVGPYTADDNSAARQLWTPVLLANEAIIELSVLASEKDAVQLRLSQVGHGYRFFGSKTAYCKSGACNTDVACIADDSPWQQPRRAVASISEGGSRFCTGSLLNNTAGDRKMLFATATHCTVNAASLVAYWNFESPTCRTPGSAASGQIGVGPVNQTSTGATFRAATNNPFAGGGAANTRSDFTLVEFNQPHNPAHNLYWAGWDRTDTAPQCCSPYSAEPCEPARYCASIHHPDGDEKRITFIREPMTTGNISSAASVHWHVRWDLTPSLDMLPNLPLPLPASLPVSVTEPGSSGSPLYNDQQQFIGVLSGGWAACGAPAADQYDLYGKLFHAWEGLGTPATRVKDWLDPLNTGASGVSGAGTCEPPPVPTDLTATPNGNNRIDLTWNPVTGATGYRIYRGVGTCPGTGFVQIGESSTPDFSDITVSGGTSYVYKVASYDAAQDCESAQGTCSAALATGECALPPSFPGLLSATSAGTSSCGITLAWESGSANCGSDAPVYNVYRSQTPGFIPDASTLIESCVSATTLLDTDVSHGNGYEYIVRAEDPNAVGSGQCGGLEDLNLIRRSAVPAGADQIVYSDDVEDGTGLFTVAGSGTGANFTIVTSASSSPSHAWFVPDPAGISDRQLVLPLDLSDAVGQVLLRFEHRYATEDGYDGSVLEYSLDGTQWHDILAGNGGAIPANPARFVTGGYNSTIDTGFSNPIGGRQAWSGNVGSSFVPAQVDLTDLAGHSIQLRWRFASDASIGSTGWWIDDFSVSIPQACGSPLPPLIFEDGFETP